MKLQIDDLKKVNHKGFGELFKYTGAFRTEDIPQDIEIIDSNGVLIEKYYCQMEVEDGEEHYLFYLPDVYGHVQSNRMLPIKINF